MSDTAEELEKILIDACNGESADAYRVEQMLRYLRHVFLDMPSNRFGETAAFGIPCGASFHDGYPNLLFLQEDGASEYVGMIVGMPDVMSNWVWPLRSMKGGWAFRNYGKPVLPWFNLPNNMHLLEGEGRNPLVHTAFSLVQTCIGARDCILPRSGAYSRKMSEQNARPWVDLLKGFLLWECELLPKFGLQSRSWRYRVTTRSQLVLSYDGRDVVVDWEEYECAEDLKDKILSAKEALDKETPFLS